MPIMSYHHGPQTLNVFDVIAVDEMISLYFEIALELCLSFKNGRILQKDKVLTCKLQLWPQKGKFFWWNRFQKVLTQLRKSRKYRLKQNIQIFEFIFFFFVFFLPIVWIIFVGSKPPIRFPLGLYPISSSKYKIKIENTYLVWLRLTLYFVFILYLKLLNITNWSLSHFPTHNFLIYVCIIVSKVKVLK